MSAPTPYIHFGGTARQALSFYADVFGGAARLHTFAEFSRSDGPPERHRTRLAGRRPVALYASDAADEEPVFNADGLMFSLLGVADPATLRRGSSACRRTAR